MFCDPSFDEFRCEERCHEFNDIEEGLDRGGNDFLGKELADEGFVYEGLPYTSAFRVAESVPFEFGGGLDAREDESGVLAREETLPRVQKSSK